MLTYLLLGCVSGFFAGMLGIGGGFIVVPGLMAAFAHEGFAAQHQAHMALGTTLAGMAFAAASSAHAHRTRNSVDLAVARRLLPGVVIGSLAGFSLATQLSGATLKLILGGVLLYSGMQMLMRKAPRPIRSEPGKMEAWIASLLIGGVYSLAGVGGASISVLFMTWHGLPIHLAVGTTALLVLPMAVISGLGYLLAGLSLDSLPAWSLGYVYLPALAGVTIGSVASAPLGAHVAHRLPVDTLRGVFAVLLLLLGGELLRRQLGAA